MNEILHLLLHSVFYILIFTAFGFYLGFKYHEKKYVVEEEEDSTDDEEYSESEEEDENPGAVFSLRCYS